MININVTNHWVVELLQRAMHFIFFIVQYKYFLLDSHNCHNYQIGTHPEPFYKIPFLRAFRRLFTSFWIMNRIK